MNEIRISAPGKLVLSGEYVVLNGAPALATAVDRRASVGILRTKHGSHTLRCPGYVDGEWRFRNDGGGSISWLDEPPAADSFRLLEEIWKRIDVDPDSPLSITIDTRDLHDRAWGEKLGLGSSAAVAVAVSIATCRILECDDDPHAIAQAAHRSFQDDRGSGVDVATSLHGGTIEFVSGQEVRRCTWPRGLLYAFMWSGQSSSTMKKLQDFDVSGRRLPDNSAAADLAGAAAETAEKWSQGNPRDIVASFRAYTESLSRFDVDHGLGIFDAGHRQVTKLADNPAIAYKPCGAGGGDVGMMLAIDEDVARDFTDRAARLGFTSPGLTPDAPGAASDRE